LLAGYKILDNVLETRSVKQPILVIADGHASRFDEDVMSLCQKKDLRQFILPPYTSEVTQKHNQLNDRLHKKYEEAKANKFSCYAALNSEDFMTFLSVSVNMERVGSTGGNSKSWEKGRHQASGLHVTWMDQGKFERAESIINPRTPEKAQSSSTIDSLLHLRKGTLEYYKYKYEQAKEKMETLEKTPFDQRSVF